MDDPRPVNDAAQHAEAQRFRKQSRKIGRKLSRRLSLIAKVPNVFNVKPAENRQPAAPQQRPVEDAAVDRTAVAHEITVIAPDKTQRLVSELVS